MPQTVLTAPGKVRSRGSGVSSAGCRIASAPCRSPRCLRTVSIWPPQAAAELRRGGAGMAFLRRAWPTHAGVTVSGLAWSRSAVACPRSCTVLVAAGRGSVRHRRLRERVASARCWPCGEGGVLTASPAPQPGSVLRPGGHHPGGLSQRANLAVVVLARSLVGHASSWRVSRRGTAQGVLRETARHRPYAGPDGCVDPAYWAPPKRPPGSYPAGHAGGGHVAGSAETTINRTRCCPRWQGRRLRC